jgi:hypothetical protein
LKAAVSDVFGRGFVFCRKVSSKKLIFFVLLFDKWHGNCFSAQVVTKPEASAVGAGCSEIEWASFFLNLIKNT